MFACELPAAGEPHSYKQPKELFAFQNMCFPVKLLFPPPLSVPRGFLRLQRAPSFSASFIIFLAGEKAANEAACEEDIAAPIPLPSYEAFAGM